MVIQVFVQDRTLKKISEVEAVGGVTTKNLRQGSLEIYLIKRNYLNTCIKGVKRKKRKKGKKKKKN